MILQRLSHVLQKAGAAVHIEPNWFEGKRPDATVHFAHENSMIDCSITHPSAPSFCQAAAGRALSAASRREKQKIAKFGPLARAEGSRFVPFVLESFGSFGDQAIKYIREIRQNSIEPHATPITSAYMVRILAVCLQAGNAFTLLSGCLQAREWGTAVRRQRAFVVERVDRDSDAEDEVEVTVSDDEDETGQVVSFESPAQPSTDRPEASELEGKRTSASSVLMEQLSHTGPQETGQPDGKQIQVESVSESKGEPVSVQGVDEEQGAPCLRHQGQRH
jgi:hypothetical protein